MKTNRKNLVDILQAVKPGIAAKEIIEHSTSFIFHNNCIMTCNDEIYVSHPLPKELELEGAVQAKEFLALLNKLTDEEIDIECSQSEIKVKGKKSKAGIKLSTADNVDDLLSAIGTPKKWQKIPEKFLDGINFCLFSTGNDFTKPLLTCVYCNGEKMYSTDGYRITTFSLSNKKVTETMLIPSNAAAELKSFKPKEFSSTSGWIHFKTTNDVIFSCRTIEGEFPAAKIDTILENSQTGQKAKLPTDLTDALDRAGIFSSTAIKNDSRIKITLDDGLLTVRGEGSIGWFEESSRIRYKGEGMEFEVSPVFLQDILSHTTEVIIGDSLLAFEGENFIHAISVLAPKAGKK